jgi:hypothetical protein
VPETGERKPLFNKTLLQHLMPRTDSRAPVWTDSHHPGQQGYLCSGEFLPYLLSNSFVKFLTDDVCILSLSLRCAMCDETLWLEYRSWHSQQWWWLGLSMPTSSTQ